MSQQAHQPNPENILQTGTGFWVPKILLSAVKFQLFTKLAESGTMSARDIKSHLGLKCTDRHVYDYLDTLTSFGFLNREGTFINFNYRIK